jgi:hypothetical protein
MLRAAKKGLASQSSKRSTFDQVTEQQAAKPAEVSQVRGTRGPTSSAFHRVVAHAADLAPTRFTRTPLCCESRGGVTWRRQHLRQALRAAFTGPPKDPPEQVNPSTEMPSEGAVAAALAKETVARRSQGVFHG